MAAAGEAVVPRSRHAHLNRGEPGQCDLDWLRKTYHIPADVVVRNCTLDEHAAVRDNDSNEIPLFSSYFKAGLKLPMHPFTRDVLRYAMIAPSQGSGNFYRLVCMFMLLGKLTKKDMHYLDIFELYMMRQIPMYGGFYFQRRPKKDQLFPVLPDNDKNWDRFPLMVSGNWEYGTRWRRMLEKPIPRNMASLGRDEQIREFDR